MLVIDCSQNLEIQRRDADESESRIGLSATYRVEKDHNMFDRCFVSAPLNISETKEMESRKAEAPKKKGAKDQDILARCCESKMSTSVAPGADIEFIRFTSGTSKFANAQAVFDRL